MPTPLKIMFTQEAVPAAELGQRLSERRQARDLTQAELGKRLRVSAGAIASWEGGAMPSMSLCERIYAFLAVDPPDPPFTDDQITQLGQRLSDHWGLEPDPDRTRGNA